MKKLNKNVVLLILILFIGAFLRMYRLDELMPFIADQGWYYISARDMLLTGEIPLVGITSSHIWLHQGAYWTYILGILFIFFNFNPIVPSYFIAILGVITIWLVYKLGKELFSERIGLISALLFATSPLIVADSRMAYHTSPIPLLTALLIFSVYRWVSGKIIYFPITILLLAVLYNLEIATFSLAGIVFLIAIFGLVKRKKWMMGVFKPKIIFFSAISFLIPMIPFLLYDIKNGFPQTIKVVIWVFYRLAVFLGYPPLNPNAPGETWTTFTVYILDLIKKLIFLPSTEISIIILFTGFIYLVYKIVLQYKKQKIKVSYILIFMFFLIPSVAYIAAKTNSAAYLLIFFPQVTIMLALLFDRFIEEKNVLPLAIVFILLFVVLNINLTIKKDFLTGPPFTKRIEVAKRIITESNNRSYNIVGRGEGSIYESFITPHVYLTWWLGYPPSVKEEELKFYITEYPDRIVVEETE